MKGTGWTGIMLPIAALAFLTAILAQEWARPRVPNCGGNSAALNVCRNYVLGLRIISTERGTNRFSISDLNETERQLVTMLPGRRWLQSSRFLVQSQVDLSTRSIVIVCDTPFDNVPRRRFGKAPLTHAVGYSTGEAALISIEQFRKLNLSGFIDHALLEAASFEDD